MLPRPATIERRALVVEDNSRAAELTVGLLEANGWSVDWARDGFEAILRFRARAYDALLLDYRLPGMDGVEVLNWVRRNVSAAPEVVVVSSESADFLNSQFGGLGVRAILRKPLDAGDLIDALPA